MADGFLGRWAKRKEAVRKGEEVAADPVVEVKAPSPQASPASGRGGLQGAVAPSPPRGEGGVEGQTREEAPPPTLEDVQALTPASDFSRFVQPGVALDVKNAAMKKLFSDPHFNIMDRLDTYIDDYSQPDPIPPEMLRKLVSAQFLDLFDEKKNAKGQEEAQAQADADAQAEAGKAPTVREVADDLSPQTVAQSGTAARTDLAVPPAEDHADPDLRLQQDDAPGPAGPGTRS